MAQPSESYFNNCVGNSSLKHKGGIIMSKLIKLVLAAAGGFVAGVLLAPKSGKETREDLKAKAEEAKKKAKVA